MSRSHFAAGAILSAVALGAAAQNPTEPYRIFGLPAQPKAQPKGQPWWGGDRQPPPRPEAPPWWAGIPRPQPQPQPQQPWWAGIPAPPQPAFVFARPSVQLRGVERDADQFSVKTARSWGTRLGADMDQLKLDAAAAQLTPAARRVVTDRANAVLEVASAVERLIDDNNRREWPRAEAAIDAALDELGRAVAQNAGADPVLRLSVARARYAAQQLGVALTLANDPTPDQMRRLVRRLGAGLANQAERLQDSLAGTEAAAPGLDRDVRQFVKAAARFNAGMANAADFTQVRKDLVALGAEWDDVALAIGRFPNLPAMIQYQATRVDGLYRKLAELFEVGVTLPVGPVAPQPRRVSVLAVGADDGMAPRVVVYADEKGNVAHAFDAYSREQFKSGVRVAVADLNGDGLPEVVTVPGGGRLGRLWVFDGRDMTPAVRIDAFDKKDTTFGYCVAAADLTRDGRALVAIAPDTGGPSLVEVYDLAAGKLVATVPAFGREFVGGTRLAWGDVNADGFPDLVTATGPGQIGTEVKVFDGRNFTKVLSEFHVLEAKYQGGAWVAAADLTRSNKAEIVVGLDGGARPLVRVFEGNTGKLLGQTEPFPNTFRGGVRVAVGDPEDGARMKIIAAPGPGGRDLPVKVIRPDGKVVADLDPFPRANRGMFVGSR